MGDTTPTTDTPEARRLQMLDLWGATLEGLKARLEGDDAANLTASFFDTCVGFLRDNGITAETAAEAKEAMEDLKMAALVQSIVDLDDDADADDAGITPPKAPAKTESAQAVVAPLERPFDLRTPRS